MNYWKLRLLPRSLQLTPWQADTFFGSLCWALVHRQGEEALRRFLTPFMDHDPPFLLSDGFPEGYLPVPLFHRVRHQESPDPTAYAQNKQRKKMAYVPEAAFADLCTGGPLSLSGCPPPLVDQQAQLHCTIDRITGTTKGGEDESTMSLFQLEGWIPADPARAHTILVAERHEGALEPLWALFQDLAMTGFGKKKSSGMGQFQLGEEPQAWHPALPSQPNGFVSLSGFIPASSDPTRGYWQVAVKHGKLGEAYARGGDPFKKPWIHLLPGSCFFTDTQPETFYGRMLPHLSKQYPEVMQYGYAFPYPICFPADDHVTRQ